MSGREGNAAMTGRELDQKALVERLARIICKEACPWSDGNDSVSYAKKEPRWTAFKDEALKFLRDPKAKAVLEHFAALPPSPPVHADGWRELRRTPQKGEEHIPAARWSDLWEYHLGVAGEGEHGYDWSDKPHRLVYNLTALIAHMRESALPPPPGDKP